MMDEAFIYLRLPTLLPILEAFQDRVKRGLNFYVTFAGDERKYRVSSSVATPVAERQAEGHRRARIQPAGLSWTPRWASPSQSVSGRRRPTINCGSRPWL
ncbi:MAG: hypothetical protein JO166_00535 [Deltaproteobacteria bacterium]|nr:hypothetical protein [Deltaproteobacteria bacterium]